MNVVLLEATGAQHREAGPTHAPLRLPVVVVAIEVAIVAMAPGLGHLDMDHLVAAEIIGAIGIGVEIIGIGIIAPTITAVGENEITEIVAKDRGSLNFR